MVWIIGINHHYGIRTILQIIILEEIDFTNKHQHHIHNQYSLWHYHFRYFSFDSSSIQFSFRLHSKYNNQGQSVFNWPSLVIYLLVFASLANKMIQDKNYRSIWSEWNWTNCWLVDSSSHWHVLLLFTLSSFWLKIQF